jgi:A/G-specific adenine glycosylase
VTASISNTISDILIAWYDRNARELPWRNPPGAPVPNDDAWPYRVWLSEVMLQQTTVAAVKPYFAKFTQKWPTVFDLAAAGEDDVMAAWAGLGYYSRARNLVKCAGVVASRGGFPETEAELRELPGLGAYTAAAIAGIAFGQRAVIVDANVERVVSRLFAIDIPLPGARKAIRARAEGITPQARSGDFAQALMDLGSQICTSKAPRCLLCPLSEQCAGRKAGAPERLPIKAPKKTKPERQGTAFWIERGEGSAREVWLVKRPGEGMLGGMRSLPDDGWSAREDGSAKPPIAGEVEELGSVRHTFTHAHLTLRVVRISATENPPGEGEWWDAAQAEDAGLPTLFAKAARLALARD